MKGGELPTIQEIKEILRLEGEDADKKLEKMLSDFGEEFSQRERLFILFYTNPLSKYCGHVNKSGAAVGGSARSWGSWALNQPHVRKRVDQILNENTLKEIEDIFREDIKFCKDVLSCDRTAFKKDNVINLDDKNLHFEVIEDKQIKELSETQRKMVSGFDYDKNGKAHFTIETRASARQALANYYKLFGQKSSPNEEKKTETIVTLEAIKNKATAKIQIIEHNNAEAELAGDFFETMHDQDEEA